MHVRWDIISLVGGNFPGPANPGGSASASAANGGDTITLTGTGTFVAGAINERDFLSFDLATGRELRGMFGPHASLSPHTMDLLAEEL